MVVVKLSFKNIFPNSYKLVIPAGSITDYPHKVRSDPISRQYIISGYESAFDAILKIPSNGDDGDIRFAFITSASPPPSPQVIINFKGKSQIDLTSNDILTSTIYLGKTYRNLEQESPVLIVKDPTEGSIDILKNLYKIGQSSVEFHSDYGTSAESSKIVLKRIDGQEPLEFLFTWEKVIASQDKRDLKNLYEFLFTNYKDLNLGDTYSIAKDSGTKTKFKF